MGRAGRSGCPALSVLFYSEAEEKKCVDPALKLLCSGKENCQRSTLLKGLGSTESSNVTTDMCCDACNPQCPLSSLVLFRVPCKRKKRPLAVRKISKALSKSLEERLTHDLDHVIENTPELLMLPKSVVCPVNVIKEVCSRSKYITTLEDIYSIPCLRPEFHTIFFNSVLETVSHAPPVKRRCRRRC